jgi:hypothetical protein
MDALAVCTNAGRHTRQWSTPDGLLLQPGRDSMNTLATDWRKIETVVPITGLETTNSNLASVLDSICDFLQRYVRFSSPAQPTAIALWIAHTWALDAFDYSPHLNPMSPEKRCGKTRLLDCIALLARNPWQVVSPSEAVLFRKIEANTPTLLLDEVDTVFSSGKDEGKESLRVVLNSGSGMGRESPALCWPESRIEKFWSVLSEGTRGNQQITLYRK